MNGNLGLKPVAISELLGSRSVECARAELLEQWDWDGGGGEGFDPGAGFGELDLQFGSEGRRVCLGEIPKVLENDGNVSVSPVHTPPWAVHTFIEPRGP